MKKALPSLLLILIIAGSFLAGVSYNRSERYDNHNVQKERRILHYVDPMNPSHVSDKPGLAPCGMPMEPVYEEESSAGVQSSTGGAPMPAGAVRISPEKQQIMGVLIDTVQVTSHVHKFRSLGRVAPDEDRVYPLIASTDGWVSDFHESTTGSIVNKDQLLALIKVYNYDFFSWQQRYLAELGSIGRRRQPPTPFTGARQPLGVRSRVSPPGSLPTEDVQMDAMHDDEDEPVHQDPEMMTTAPEPDSEGGAHQTGTTRSVKTPPVEKTSKVALASDDLNLREDDILYESKAKLELLNLGVGKAQLDALVRTGRYATFVELRSPVSGLVLTRSVFPQQKVDRGAECFRIADLSKVWILADVFDVEERYIQQGVSARISFRRQNRSFEAKVTKVPPRFDETTRTLKVRLEMENPDNVLRPGMFVDVDFLINLPPAIAIPADAVLDNGMRKIVFVAKGNGFFEPRQVMTGWKFGDKVEIVEGLTPGEQIVISGNFLINSESKMRLAAAGMHGEPETDPACGALVYPRQALASGLTRHVDGRTYYFSSEECLKLFEKGHRFSRTVNKP